MSAHHAQLKTFRVTAVVNAVNSDVRYVHITADVLAFVITDVPAKVVEKLGITADDIVEISEIDTAGEAPKE